MAYYDALKDKIGKVSGATTAEKIEAVNALTVTGPAIAAIVQPSAILNAITPADFAALDALQIAKLTLLLSSGSVDISSGTTVRQAIQNIFADKAETLANLEALVAPFESPQIPYWKASKDLGGAGLTSPVSADDLRAADIAVDGSVAVAAASEDLGG